MADSPFPRRRPAWPRRAVPGTTTVHDRPDRKTSPKEGH